MCRRELLYLHTSPARCMCSVDYTERISTTKMTKLDRLNTFMTERLMEAVKEILLTVGRTLREYEEETERIRTENERLKEMLRASGGFLEYTDAALQTGTSRDEEPEPLEIQQNQRQTLQIKTEEVDACHESAALPGPVDSRDPYGPDTNRADGEMTDFPAEVKVEISNLCSIDDVRMDAYHSCSLQSPDIPAGPAHIQASHRPHVPAHASSDALPSLSQHCSLSNGARHLSYHSILCTNSTLCNSKCCELQKRTVAKSSPVWKYFSLKEGDCSKAVCLMCKAVISRGRKEYTTSALLKHLRMKHGKC